jgi:hypothetical protein
MHAEILALLTKPLYFPNSEHEVLKVVVMVNATTLRKSQNILCKAKLPFIDKL